VRRRIVSTSTARTFGDRRVVEAPAADAEKDFARSLGRAATRQEAEWRRVALTKVPANGPGLE